MTEKCYFCDSTDTKYCHICKESFCEKHRNDPDRITEFFRKKGIKWIPNKKGKDDLK